MAHAQVLAPRRSIAAAATGERTTAKIQERHMKHMAEITKDLAPFKGQELNDEQKQWLYFRMGRPFPKPYTPFPKTKKNFEFKTFSFAEVVASVEPLQETD